MTEMISDMHKIGWRFDNSYARLPETMLSRLAPTPVKTPKLIIFNRSLSKDLGLDFSTTNEEYIASMFAGNILPQGSESIAQAYAGHQFGYFTNLGDGRAILIGEHLTPDNRRVDIQFKGSGKTPYSRDGDGRATLGPMLREYIISEAVHALGIPTTRSIAVVTTGENVIRETPLQGAILTRVAASHIRVGTFQYLAMRGDIKTLRNLVDYSIERHYPNIKDSDSPAIDLLEAVIEKQAKLITNWMRVGFIHGVMNTDNMTISGETIDYGPCAFMDSYDPATVFSSIDHQGRYAYANQAAVGHWNLSRFAETLLPLIDVKKEKAVESAELAINNYAKIYKKFWIKMMCEKLGLLNIKDGDEKLINDLLSWMHKGGVDFTNLFRSLMWGAPLDSPIFQDGVFVDWHKRWQSRLIQNEKPKQKSLDLMRKNNPAIIPRNHKVEEALSASVDCNSLSPLYALLEVLKNPYEDRLRGAAYQSPPDPGEKAHKTFCGT